MKGLLIKDFKLLKGQKNFFMTITAISIIMIIVSPGTSFPIGFLGFVGALFSLSSISYDEFDNGNAFLFSLPITRKDYVLEKYIFGLISGIMFLLLGTVISLVVIGITKTGSFNEIFLTAGSLFPTILLILSIMLPFILKFGGEKGRIAIIGVMGFIFVIGLSFISCLGRRILNVDMLRITNLKKHFGDKEVLTGLNLSVPEHSVFGFVGENGAGKTTTMKIILGLLKSDRGEVFVSGERVKYGQTATNRYIGYLPDVPEFYSFMTAREYLRLCGESLEMGKNDIEKRSDELLTLVGLSKENHRIRGFSRGMKQRLGIAQALLGRPKILICDEPTSALDPIGRKEILDILLSSKKQTTVLFSTHILSDVERICTDVAFLNNGKIAMQGAVADLKNVCSSHEFIVETIKADDAEYLSSVFTDAQLTAKDTLLFLGEQFKMFEVLEFITEHKILISKIERVEPSLESLFMEVVSK